MELSAYLMNVSNKQFLELKHGEEKGLKYIRQTVKKFYQISAEDSLQDR